MKTLVIILSNELQFTKEMTCEEAEESYQDVVDTIVTKNPEDFIELGDKIFRIGLIDYVGIEESGQ